MTILVTSLELDHKQFDSKQFDSKQFDVQFSRRQPDVQFDDQFDSQFDVQFDNRNRVAVHVSRTNGYVDIEECRNDYSLVLADGKHRFLFIVQFCVAYSFQQLGQFSVRTMMLGTLVVALLILLGRFLSDAFWGWGLYYYICAIYFAPVVFAVLTIFAKWYSRRRRMTQQRVADEVLGPYALTCV